VPSPPGASPDRWARQVAPFLERAWPRQKLVLRNLAGRGGLAALAELAAARPGGRMIGVLTTPVLLARAVEANESSPLDRIAPLGALIEEPVVLVAAPGGVASLEALRAQTGVSFGTPPPGTAAHMAGMRLAERAGVTPLVFPSAAAARQAAAGGHVAAAALALPDAIAFLRENRLVGLGIASSQRAPLLPELPTLREAGLELLGATRRGFALPPDTPAEWRAWLVEGLQKLAEDPDLTAQCTEAGQIPRFLGPEPWTALLRRQEDALRRRWREDPWLPRRT
jgi:tripartite-type tricarboxylate transporter receptor subunit TctC